MFVNTRYYKIFSTSCSTYINALCTRVSLRIANIRIKYINIYNPIYTKTFIVVEDLYLQSYYYYCSLSRLQRILNTAARILCKIPKFDHITELLLDLDWLPIQQRILFKILILTYQAYHKTAPQYLCDLIMPYSNARNLRSDNMLLIAPCHPRAKLKSYGERSFQYAAPTEWNKLPLLICESPSLDIFKTQLETFLFKSILEP